MGLQGLAPPPVIALDTSILSAVFRRRPAGGAPLPAAELFRRLVEADEPMFVPGIVLQELLTGTRTTAHRKRLESVLEGFEVRLATSEDHLNAATLGTACRRAGIAAGAVDCLIAAQAALAGARLFTLDRDFLRIAPLAGLELVG